jgi:hypothetical protein
MMTRKMISIILIDVAELIFSNCENSIFEWSQKNESLH